MAMRTETSRSIVGATSWRTEPRAISGEAPPTSTQPDHSRQAECHMQELRSDMGLPNSGRGAEPGSEKVLTPEAAYVFRRRFTSPGRFVARDLRRLG
jgi:hypothetical protein